MRSYGHDEDLHTMDTEIVHIPIQRSFRVHCLVKSEVNPVKFFHSIVTGNESWIRHYDPLRQLEAKNWKRPGEQTPTPLHQERSAGKMMMIIFWDRRWCSAHWVPTTWNHDQWSFRCIIHWTTAFCHCAERAWKSYSWSCQRVDGDWLHRNEWLCLLHRLIPIHCQTLNKFRILSPMTKQWLLLTNLDSEFFWFSLPKFQWAVAACEGQYLQ